jgi:putative GTP pyrophosphokinase
MNCQSNNFNWKAFLQPYELAVEGFILKIEGIKKQYQLVGKYCPIEIVSGRIKTPESILDKAERLGASFDEIDKKVYDIGGIRITCKYMEDVYQIAELLKSRKDIELLEERDYIKHPKTSGYRSLHLIMKYNVETIRGQVPILLEFQIRTHAMHFWASIEHSLRYKYQKKIPQELQERLLEASKAAEKLDGEMSNIHALIDELDRRGTLESKTKDSYEDEVGLNTYKRW